MGLWGKIKVCLRILIGEEEDMGERSKFSRLSGVLQEVGLFFEEGAVFGGGVSRERTVICNGFGAPIRIESFRFLPDVALVGDDTDFLRYEVFNKGLDGTENVLIASRDYLTGIDMLAFVQSDLDMAALDADREVQENELVTLKVAGVGGGGNVPGGKFCIQYRFL